MPAMYCALCSRPVEARRRIGLGTVCLAVLTGGFWLLAIPFYPKRCSICQSTAVSMTVPRRLGDLEQRLILAQEELEEARYELERLRTERDFDRQLLGDPASRKEARRNPSE